MYTRKKIEYLLKINNNDIEVLIDNGDGVMQWLMLSIGVIITNQIIFDHRFLGDEFGVENRYIADKPYLGNSDGCAL
jgi:hypothetical protein